MIHVCARYYEFETGRWVQKDSLLNEANVYIYAKNNPIKYFDPKGLDSIKKFLGGLGAKVAILAACYRSCEDLYNEITNPRPPHLLHDISHFVGGIGLAVVGVGVGGVVGGVGVIVGVIYGAWHLAKLLEWVQ